MNIIDILVKYFWVLLLFYSAFLGFEVYEQKTQELSQRLALNETLPPKFKRVERELKEVKRFEENLAESKKRVAEVIKRIDVVQKQLPAEIKDSEVNEGLVSTSKDLKMINPNPLPKVEVDHGFYISKDFNFDVEGTFLQGLIFFEKLDNLAKNGRILNVKYLRFVESAKGDKRSRFKVLSLNTVVEAFKYNPRYSPEKKASQDIKAKAVQ